MLRTVKENASYSSMTDQASQLYIGNAYLSGYNSFSGSLADFAIYKHDGVDGRSHLRLMQSKFLVLIITDIEQI